MELHGPTPSLFVRKVMNEEFCPKKEAETILVLIPKVVNRSSIRSFRQISVCNLTFKLLTQIIMWMLREILGELIAPNQDSFVPN